MLWKEEDLILNALLLTLENQGFKQINLIIDAMFLYVHIVESISLYWLDKVYLYVGFRVKKFQLQ